MSNKKANFLLLLDKSGSMSGVYNTTVDGVDDFINAIAESSKENGVESTVSVITFDDKVDVEPGLMHQDPATFGSIKKHYTIRGGTSIYDALGVGISGFDPEDGEVVVALFTDGGEYNSSTYNQTSAGAVIKGAKARGWTVAYVSPVYNAESFAAALHIPKGNVLQYQSGKEGTRSAFSKLGRAVERYIESLAESSIVSSRTDFFSGIEQGATMKIKGMQVVLNMPRALKSKKKGKGEEEAQKLPPHYPVEAHVVDEHPDCPATWMNGSAKASSYFVAVKPDRGMWLDFNGCDKEYDVATVVSVQGVNPITGQKSDSLRLERYENKCPKHDCEFKQDRYCDDCGFKWPAQNYLATSATPDGQFWLDGFRTEDGKIRQYIFTEEMARGVANAVIGDDKVYAIGIAFFKSKKKKPKPVQPQYEAITRSAMLGGGYRARGLAVSGAPSYAYKSMQSFSLNSVPKGGGGFESDMFAAPVAACSDGGAAPAEMESTAVMDFADDGPECIGSSEIAPKSYEVGAGAAIDQKLHEDKESLDYWENEPAGFVYINYTDQETVRKILAAGKRKEKKEGFLSGVPVGN